jgi:hypothetical protein
LFTGWGEDKDTYGRLHAGEDMCMVLPNFIFYERVCNKNFSSSQQHSSEFIIEHVPLVVLKRRKLESM